MNNIDELDIRPLSDWALFTLTSSDTLHQYIGIIALCIAAYIAKEIISSYCRFVRTRKEMICTFKHRLKTGLMVMDGYKVSDADTLIGERFNDSFGAKYMNTMMLVIPLCIERIYEKTEGLNKPIYFHISMNDQYEFEIHILSQQRAETILKSWATHIELG